MMLESESDLISKFFGNTGIGIRIGITSYWNRNWNRNHGFWQTLELESESALVESESWNRNHGVWKTLELESALVDLELE